MTNSPTARTTTVQLEAYANALWGEGNWVVDLQEVLIGTLTVRAPVITPLRILEVRTFETIPPISTSLIPEQSATGAKAESGDDNS